MSKNQKTRIVRVTAVFVLVAAFLVSYSSPSFAAISNVLSFQGRLTDSVGNLLGGQNGTTFFYRFSIYNSATGGTLLWENHPTNGVPTKTTQGVFTVLLGDSSLANMSSLSAAVFEIDPLKRYLEVEVSTLSAAGPFETMSPRQRIGSALTAGSVFGGIASVSLLNVTGNTFGATASFSGNLEVSGRASSSATFGSGLSDCDGTLQKLLWNVSTGLFSCGIDQSGSSGTAIGVNESGSAFTNVTSISFAASHFNVTFPGEALVRLDWGAGGPASLSQDETVTGLWTFTTNPTFAGGSRLVSSNSLDFDEFSNAMTVDVATSVNAAAGLTFTNASVSGTFETAILKATTLTSDTNQIQILGAASVSTNFEVAGNASASATYGSGLTLCTAANNFLQWNAATGRFSCGTTSSDAFAGIGVREDSSATFLHITSISFAAPHFNITNTGSQSFVRLDWGTGGPASLSQDETVTGHWNFTNGASFSGPVEFSNGASFSSIAVPLSSITAAVAANSIGSGDNAQSWNWSLTTASKSAFTFGEVAAATGVGNRLLRINTLATSTATPLFINNLGSASSLIIHDSASDSSPFVVSSAGHLGIGTTPGVGQAFNITKTFDNAASGVTQNAIVITTDATVTAGVGQTRGILATVKNSSTTTGTGVLSGALFIMQANGSQNYSTNNFSGISLSNQTLVGQTGTIVDVQGIRINTPSFVGSIPTANMGLNLLNQGFAGVASSSALTIRAQTGSTNNYAILSASGNRHGFGTFAPTRTVDIVGTLGLVGNASISGTFGPGTDNTYDLGSPTRRWHSLYVASSSLHIGIEGSEARFSYDTALGFLGVDFTGDDVPEVRFFSNGTSSLSGALETSAYASASQLFGAGLADCDTAITSKLLWDVTTGLFSCGTDQNSAVSSNSLDFDEFENAMNLDANTTITAGAFSITFDHASVSSTLEVDGSLLANGGIRVIGQTGSSIVRLASVTGADILRITQNGDFDFKRDTDFYIPASGSFSIISTASSQGKFEIKYNRSPFGSQVMAGAFIGYNSTINEEFNRHRNDIAADTTGNNFNAFGGWGVYESTGTGCNFSNPSTPNGVLRLDTQGNTAGCMTMLDLANGDIFPLLASASLPVLEMKVAVSVADSGHAIYAGAGTDIDGTLARPTDFIGFSNDGTSSTSWFGTVIRAGVKTNVACSQTISTTRFAVVMVEVRATNDIHFFVDPDVSNGVELIECGTGITSGAPNPPMTTQVSYQRRSGTASGFLDLDFYRAWMDDNSTITRDGIPVTPNYASESSIAFLYPTEDTSIGAGDVVSLDQSSGLPRVVKASTSYDPKAFGVVVVDPMLQVGNGTFDGVKVAEYGRASVKVSTANGNIAVGDYLATSTTPGVAVKANANPVIGRAVSAYSSGGIGRVVINLRAGVFPDIPIVLNAGSVSSNFEVVGTASVSGSMFANGGLTATSFAGGGLTPCTGSQFLQYSGGQFSCATPTSTAFAGIDAGVSGATQVKITSISFDAGMFDFTNTASSGLVKLDWVNGPASRAAANTWTGQNTFNGGVSVSTNFEVTGNNRIGINAGGSTDTSFEVGGAASISGTLFANGALTVAGQTTFVNSSGSGRFELTSATSRLGVNAGGTTDTMFEVGGTASISGTLFANGALTILGQTSFVNASGSGSFELTSATSRLGVNAGGTTDTMFEVGGTASISGKLNLANSASISLNLEASGYASASSYFGGGLTDCDGTGQKLRWTASGSNAGKFSCAVAASDLQHASSRDTAEAVTNITAAQTILGTVSVTPSTVTGDVYVTGQADVYSSNGTDQPFTLVVETGATCAGTTVGNATVTYTISSAGGTEAGTLIVSGIAVDPGTAAQPYSLCASASAGDTDVKNWSIEAMVIDTGADVAEIYTTNDGSIDVGDVVSIDASLQAGMKKSAGVYDQNVLGIVSTKPGLVIGGVENEGVMALPVALSGRVPVKFSSQNGAVLAGDYLTTSSIPGVAMKATKAGPIIGQALHDYTGEGDGGTVLVFVKDGYYNGDSQVSVSSDPSSDLDILTALISGQASLASTSLESFIRTDRIVAGLDVVAPTITTQKLTAEILSFGSDSISFRELIDGTGRIENLQTQFESAASQSNALESFVLDAKAMFESDGLQLTQAVASQSARVDTLSDRLQAAELNLAMIASQSHALTFDSPVLFEGGLRVDSIAALADILTIGSDVYFFGRPYYTGDVGGFALIKAGQTRVDVEFEKPYIWTPVIHATIAVGAASASDELEQLLLNSEVRTIVTRARETGFTILLNAPMEFDVPLNWTATAIRDARTFTSVEIRKIPVSEPTPVPTVRENTAPVPTPAPEPTDIQEVVPTPVQTEVAVPSDVPSPAPTAEATPLPSPEPIAEPVYESAAESSPEPQTELETEPVTDTIPAV